MSTVAGGAPTAFSLRYLRAVTNSIVFFEGDRYTDDPADHGGATKYGLTARFLQAHLGPAVLPPQYLTLEDALAIYWTHIWIPQRLGGLAAADLAAKVFDMMLPMGEPQAARYFQHALNDALRGMLPAPLVIDGVIGEKTIAVANGAGGRAAWIMGRLIALSRQHYEHLAQRDPSQAKWLPGWLRRADYDPSRLLA